MTKIDRIIELLESISEKLDSKPKTKKRGSKNKVDDQFWPSYAKAFENRYKVSPERNAMINGMISSLKKRVSAADLEILAEFYLSQNDSWYLREMHHIRCLVKDCEILLIRMKSKIVITSSKAKEIEKHSDNMNESQRYLQNKYRGTK